MPAFFLKTIRSQVKKKEYFSYSKNAVLICPNNCQNYGKQHLAQDSRGR
jgi:hypothetical protein